MMLRAACPTLQRMNKTLSNASAEVHHPLALIIALCVCLLILAIGALPAGWSFIVQPDGSGIGMPMEWLEHTPFSNFVIPGLILFVLFGIGSLVALFGLIARPRWTWVELITRPLHLHWALVAATLLGSALCIWIIVQLLMTQHYFFLQPVMFGIGVAILVLALLPAMRRDYRM